MRRKEFIKTLSTTIIVLFFTTSLSQGMNIDDFYYTWQDDFENEQLIESSMSYDFEIDNGVAKIKNTYPIWTDADWKKMKIININNLENKILQNYAIHLLVDFDSDMKDNYGDIRFKDEANPTLWLPQWIENYDYENADIWVNIPTIPMGSSKIYMFYGNPNAQKKSNFYEVFEKWEEQWPNDNKVSTHVYTEGAWDPDVCFGDNKFFIVWEEGEAPGNGNLFYKQDIRGSICDIDGNFINEDFTIRSGQEPQWHHENPSVAYGGGNFFVAWEHYYTSADPSSKNIKGRFVTKYGDVDTFDTVICEADNVQGDPMVKFDSKNNRFCVVWEDARLGTNNYNIYGRLYDVNGNPIGSEKIICEDANNQFEPWIGFDHVNENYMVVYEEKKGDFEIDIYGQLFNKDLNPVGLRFKIADGTSTIRYLFPCVEFSAEADRYLVTYNSGTPSKPYRGSIYGKTYTPSGEERSSAVIKQGNNFIRTDIAPYLETAFLVCFNGGGKIWGRFITVDGEIDTYDDMGDIQLSASNSATADWVNVASGDNEIYVTWEDTRIEYLPPFNGMPDVFGNIWHLNIGDSSQVGIDCGPEKQMILNAQVTSKEINPDNLFRWNNFNAEFEGTISFDILDSNGDLIDGFEDVNIGCDLSSITDEIIRLRGRLARENPSSTPTLDQWSVTYTGEDNDPPKTTLNYIEGTKGENNWYISDSVTIWLNAADFPEQTGSGIDTTYFTIDGGSTEIYNPSVGIHLSTSQSSYWTGDWQVNFWSVDNSGNEENKEKPENQINIKIDSERPHVEIVEPVNEQEVQVPFWVRANAIDNAQIDRVEFDIEPFGERDGLPYVDDEPPYEWYCDVDQEDSLSSFVRSVGTFGVNVMVRAQVFDGSGQEWTHETWVHITNWGRVNQFQNSNSIVIASGAGSISRSGIAFGDIDWDYNSGFCLSTGLNGNHAMSGAHVGSATGFFGLASNSLVIGYANSVNVQRKYN